MKDDDQTIEWHEDYLKQLETQYNTEYSYFTKLQKNLNYLEIELKVYEQQIKQAKRKHKTSFGIEKLFKKEIYTIPHYMNLLCDKEGWGIYPTRKNYNFLMKEWNESLRNFIK